jgi:hypothetical protein
VTWAVDEFRWPHYTAAELAVINRVLNEEDVPPLSHLHELLLAAKLIRHAKHHVLLTKTGREHLGQPGRLQAVLFETFFTRFDFIARWTSLSWSPSALANMPAWIVRCVPWLEVPIIHGRGARRWRRDAALAGRT